MKKVGMVIGGLVILLVAYFFFLKTPASPPMGTLPTASEDYEPSLAAGNAEPVTRKDVMAEPESPKTVKQQVSYKVFKHQKEISFGELDRIEQLAVNFIANFFTAPKDETKEELAERLKGYFNKNYSPAEAVDVIIKNDNFPHEGERKIQAVYLLPEYLEENWGYVVPMQVNFNHKGQPVEKVIHLAIAKATKAVDGKTVIMDEPGLEFIAGHMPRQDFVNEIVKKYNLDGTR